MQNQIRSPKPLSSVGSRRVLSVCMGPRHLSFAKSRTVRFRTAFGSVLGAQKRPKTVPKRVPQRVPRPAPFCDRFSTDSRSSETQKSFKNLKKIDDFAKLGVALPSRKNVNFGSIRGLKMCRKSIKTEARKRVKNETLSGHHFCRFRDDFGAQDPPKNRPKTEMKSSETHFLATCRKPALRHPRGRNLDGFGSLRSRFLTISGRFLH